MDDCIFCKIISGKIPSKKVYEDDLVFAFEDIHPQAKNHILFVTKEHIPSLSHIKNKETLNSIYEAINKTAKKIGIEGSGYRVCVNNGPDAGQTVFHLHFHLLGGNRLSDKMV